MQTTNFGFPLRWKKHRSYIILTLRLHARAHVYYTLAASLFHGIKTQMQFWKGLIAYYFFEVCQAP